MRSKQPKPAPISPDVLKQRLYLRVAEYASLTGTPVPTVYSHISAGRIPGIVRIGNSLRIPVKSLLDLAAGDAA